MKIRAHFLAIAVVSALPAVLSAADDRPFTTWREHLGGADSSQYSSLKQIDKSNA